MQLLTNKWTIIHKQQEKTSSSEISGLNDSAVLKNFNSQASTESNKAQGNNAKIHDNSIIQERSAKIKPQKALISQNMHQSFFSDFEPVWDEAYCTRLYFDLEH